MISNPRPGQRVRLHYRASLAAVMPYHGRTGTVVIVCKSPTCRNHGVRLDGCGTVVVVPTGNLVRATT